LIKIYFIRHGLTETNKEQRFVGWSDVPLAKEGFEQVERLAERLAAAPITGLYSSDLLRARQTAEAIGRKHGLEPELSPQLREINFASWEMMTFDEITSRYDDELQRWFADPYHRKPPGGENFTEVCLRFRKHIDEITEGVTGGALVVVSHGGAITSFLHYCQDFNFLPEGLWQLRLDNASISLVEKNADGYKMVSHNDIEHLF
jgi:alpha-ribazole phosphatase